MKFKNKQRNVLENSILDYQTKTEAGENHEKVEIKQQLNITGTLIKPSYCEQTAIISNLLGIVRRGFH